MSAEHRTTAQACAPIDREEIGRKRNWGARLFGNRRDWTAIDTEYLSTGRSNHLLSPLDRLSCLPLRNPGGFLKTLQRAIRGNLSNTTEWLLMVSSAQSLKLTPPGLWFSCFCQSSAILQARLTCQTACQTRTLWCDQQARRSTDGPVRRFSNLPSCHVSTSSPGECVWA